MRTMVHSRKVVSLVLLVSLTRASLPSTAPTMTRYSDKVSARELKPAQSWNDQLDREADVHPTVLSPSPIAIALRALYLWVLFTPVLSTAVPALYSETFRRHIWYPLVCWTLAQGGAAWIK